MLRFPLFSAPFRIFFLLAGLHAGLMVAAWSLMLGGLVPMPDAPPLAWHGGEMLFGFGGAVIAGFILTAAANWTGRQTVTPGALIGLAAAWLIARLAVFTPGLQSLAAVADLLFWLGTVAAVARVLVLARNWRNLGFVAILAALLVGNLAYHCTLAGGAAGITALRPAVDLLALLMAAMGGRIVPFFTQRRFPALAVKKRPTISNVTNALMVAIPAIDLSGAPVELRVAGYGLAALFLFLRMSGWRSLRTGAEPLVWVLHLGYAWLAVGMALRAAALLAGWPETTVLHALTIGALGSLSLGMLCRVALGHTGRALTADRGLALLFILIQVAALARMSVIVPGIPLGAAWAAAGFCWAAGFTGYVLRFAPILSRPRLA